MDKQLDWRRRFVKKEYKKPIVAVERFSLVYTNARDCMDSIPKDQVTFNEKPCVWQLGAGTIVFSLGDPSAQWTCNIDGDMFGICYNNPGEGQLIFRS